MLIQGGKYKSFTHNREVISSAPEGTIISVTDLGMTGNVTCANGILVNIFNMKSSTAPVGTVALISFQSNALGHFKVVSGSYQSVFLDQSKGPLRQKTRDRHLWQVDTECFIFVAQMYASVNQEQ